MDYENAIALLACVVVLVTPHYVIRFVRLLFANIRKYCSFTPFLVSPYPTATFSYGVPKYLIPFHPFYLCILIAIVISAAYQGWCISRGYYNNKGWLSSGRH